MRLALLWSLVLGNRIRPLSEDPSDYEVVLTALYQGGWLTSPNKRRGAPISPLYPEHQQRLKSGIQACPVLDLRGKRLKRLPVKVMQQMTGLKVLRLDKNPGLKISEEDIRAIKHLEIEELTMRDSRIDLETFKSIQQLPHLVRLDLSGNAFDLISAFDLGQLAYRLVELSVSDCYLDGGWLESIFQCTKLTKLNISRNPKAFRLDPVDYCSFVSLKDVLVELDVSGCDLDDDWLKSVLQCTKLTKLNISRNPEAFHWTLEDNCSFVPLKDVLVELDISGCYLNGGWLKNILQCTKLTKLNISENPMAFHWTLAGDFSFVSLKDVLTELDVSDCYLNGSWLESILQCSRLTKLNISGNPTAFRWVPEDDFSFVPLKDVLVELDVLDCDLNDSWLESILQCSRLTKLNISRNPEAFSSKPTDDCNFALLKDVLTELDVSDCDLDGGWLESIFQCSKLAKLNISKNRKTFHWKMPRGNCSFALLKDALVELDVSDCWLDGGWQESVLQCTRLTKLNISRNRVFVDSQKLTKDSFPTRLVALNLSGCGIYDGLLKDILCRCTGVVELDISDNKDVGDDLDVFSSLKSLKRLNAKDMDLTARGLSGICRCEGLEKLDVSHNVIGTGVIDFGTCKDTLVRLDIAYTGIGKAVLESICGFTKLEALDVSGNSALGAVMSEEGFSFNKLEDTLAELWVDRTSNGFSRAIRAIRRCKKLTKLNGMILRRVPSTQ